MHVQVREIKRRERERARERERDCLVFRVLGLISLPF